MGIIELENVRKIYQLGETEVEALRGSDVEIEQGEFVAVMGPSGSGKSTLMNMIGALDIPTSGKVSIGDEDIGEMKQDELALLRSRKIGFIFQEFNLINSMNAWQNVALPMVFRDVKKSERKKRAVSLLEQVGLEERTSHRPSELSGGQRQRVSIARSLANNPEIILADEPTGNLDTKTGAKIMDLLTELNNDGKTIIMVTHDPNDAEYADRTITIIDGKTNPEDERTDNEN
ncbi:ABC transporter ATP-binding protein [Candidatus Nanohalococcus occultus]|uniref:ABC-type antimicrobial peptide transport system,ATPase component n=1 Tax=Candidatus Nanohalococcus occultus TaxID=2978047 RepID=A0ABY8CGW2_9ARCH|nr:ABC-type antimicrobial peptide transport system,ATPase component [Candidatus Nanohaloarchaeota archaeon SVXNc]